MSSREIVLWEIAERYTDLVEPLNGPTLVAGDGESLAVMPGTYTPTVREFERLMAVMRNQAKQKAFRGTSLGKLRWHILEWHLKAERVVRHQTVTAKRHGKVVPLRSGDGTTVQRLVVGYRRDPQAREQKARDGIAWMAENWALKHEPMLPEQIRVAA